MSKWSTLVLVAACTLATLVPASASPANSDPPGHPRRLSHVLERPDEVRRFVISPDGRSVWYSTDEHPGEANWVAPLGGGAPTSLGPDARCSGHCFFVSETSLLVFTRPALEGFGVMDAVTGDVVLESPGIPHSSTLDGRRLIYTDDGWIRSLDLAYPADSVALVPADEFVPREVTPSGHLLLRKPLTEVIDGVTHLIGEEIWIVSAGGGVPEKVIGGPDFQVLRLLPAPDGAAIAAIFIPSLSVSDPVHVGWYATNDAAVLNEVVLGPIGLNRARVTPDSRWVVIDDDDLWSVPRDGGPARLLTEIPRNGFGHDDWVISPDSGFVVYRGGPDPTGPQYPRQPNWVLHRVAIDGSSVEQLTFSRDVEDFQEDWRDHLVVGITPDSRWVVFFDRSPYEGRLSRVALSGGLSVDLAEEEFQDYFHSVSMSPDGRRVAFVSGEENPRFVMSVPVQGGSVVNLIPETVGSEIGQMAITPDSQSVVFIGRYTANARELWIVDIGYRCGNRFATLVGSPGPDVIEGTPLRDVIVGLGGDDVIRGGAKRDIICGGPGDDLIIGNGGRDVLRGQGGDDVIRGGYGSDRLVGGGGSDRLNGGPDVDTCVSDGNDLAVLSCEIEG